MMFIDASAIVAILANESDRPQLVDRLKRAERKVTSPIALFEAVLAFQESWATLTGRSLRSKSLLKCWK